MKEYRVLTKGAVFVDGVARKGFFAEEKKTAHLIVITPQGEILCDEIGKESPENFHIIDWGSFCQLIPKEYKQTPYEILGKESGFFRGEEITVALIKEKELFFYASIYGSTLLFPLKKNKTYRFITLWNLGIIGVYSEKEIYVFSGETGKLIFEAKGEIHFFEEGFSIEKKFDDCLERKVTEEYAFSTLSCVLQSRRFFYNKESAADKIPLLMQEAIMAKDYEKAKEYLSAELKEEIFALEEYMGNAIKILTVPKNLDRENRLCILTESGEVKIFDFDLRDGKIENTKEASLKNAD